MMRIDLRLPLKQSTPLLGAKRLRPQLCFACMSSRSSRSLSMSTSESDVRWLSLLEEKIQDIGKRGYRLLVAINDGRSFRASFEAICKRQREHRSSQLEAILLPSYTSIIKLAQGVGKSAPDLLHSPLKCTLEALIWKVSFVLIECGCRAGFKLRSVINQVAELNGTAPRFSSDTITKFPNLKEVQKPLQDVYRLFIDSNLFIIEHWNNEDCVPQPSTDEVLKNHILDTSRRLETARGQYGVMLNQAIEDDERRRAEEELKLNARRNWADVHDSRNTPKREIYARFVSVRHLGQGSFGTVEEVQETSTGASYARKHIHVDPDKPVNTIEKEVRNEVAVMQKLRHLHIATVLFYLKDNESYSIFMLPVADCDLRKFLGNCTREGFPPNLTKQIYPWFGCLLDALAYAHKLAIKHRDIKPSNILIKNHQPYLCDFGLAKDFAGWDESTSRGDKVHGTLVYRAPEVVPNGKRGRKADVFSLGCVYSEMFTVAQGRSLEAFRNARQEAGSTVFRDSLSKVKDWLLSFERNKLNDLLVDEILGMVERDAERRPSADQVENYLKRERALFCVE